MIEQQLKIPTSLFEAALNNYSKLQRVLMFIGILLIVSAFIYAEKSHIEALLFSNLPLGIGLESQLIKPLLAVGFLALSCTLYFGVVHTSKASLVPQRTMSGAGFLSELRVTIVFGACFGLLTAILCSLIFVIAERHLPQAFLFYHQIFTSLDFSLIILVAILSSSLYLSAFMLPLSLLLSRLFPSKNKESRFKLVTTTIVISSIVLALFMALLVGIVTATFSINLFIFVIIISVITSSTLGLLYWFVGLESSLVANLVYCLLVSYLAHIFL